MFVCEDCGYTSPDWLGRCPSCNQFDTLQKTAPTEKKESSFSPPAVETEPLNEISDSSAQRQHTRIGELDRVLGGGLVPGSVVLLGGAPGIGKSTLLLQWAENWDADGSPVLYVNGEESAGQVARRARRIDAAADNLELLNINKIEALTSSITKLNPSLVFIDSIQTVTSEDSSGMPGSVGQLRAVTQKVVKAAKQHGVPFVLVGHVTKEGKIGGPRRLEHMVDTVLYFDDARRGYRLIRSVKNRFGPSGEIGLFEMTGKGLLPISDPGSYFRSSDRRASGCALTITLEGSRPLLVEVQALVAPSRFGTPQRSTTGYPARRLYMMLAVLEKKLQLPLGDQDVFVNVTGGLSLEDPGADFAVALAVLSSSHDQPLPPQTTAVGELGLTGELRPPSQADRRIKECLRLNCEPVFIGGNSEDIKNAGEVHCSRTIAQAAEVLLE